MGPAALTYLNSYRKFKRNEDTVTDPVLFMGRVSLALTVGSYRRAASLYNLVSQSNRFGLSEAEARKEIRHVASVVRKWRDRFAASGVSRKDIEYIAPAMLSSSFLSEEAPQAASWHRVLLLIQTSPPSAFPPWQGWISATGGKLVDQMGKVCLRHDEFQFKRQALELERRRRDIAVLGYRREKINNPATCGTHAACILKSKFLIIGSKLLNYIVFMVPGRGLEPYA